MSKRTAPLQPKDAMGNVSHTNRTGTVVAIFITEKMFNTFIDDIESRTANSFIEICNNYKLFQSNNKTRKREAGRANWANAKQPELLSIGARRCYRIARTFDTGERTMLQRSMNAILEPNGMISIWLDKENLHHISERNIFELVVRERKFWMNWNKKEKWTVLQIDEEYLLD